MHSKNIQDRHGDNILVYSRGESVWIDCKYDDDTKLQFRSMLDKKSARELADHIKRLADELPY